MGLIPGWETKIPHAMWHGQKFFKNQVEHLLFIALFILVKGYNNLHFQ